jgi:hypothetical protein
MVGAAFGLGQDMRVVLGDVFGDLLLYFARLAIAIGESREEGLELRC